jgi:hypothetical protein
MALREAELWFSVLKVGSAEAQRSPVLSAAASKGSMGRVDECRRNRVDIELHAIPAHSFSRAPDS